MLLIFLLFKIKRLRRGMPFLYQIGSSATGFILSCFILLIVTIISFYDSIPDMQFLFLLIALFLIGLLLYCWWRFRITRDYREKLRQAGISCQGKRARQIRSEDYERFDWIVGMDDWNMRNLRRAFPGDPEGKLHKLLDFCCDGSDVADPWYTGDFDATWQDVQRGCRAMMKQIEKELKKE